MQFDVNMRDSVKEKAAQNIFVKNIPEIWDEKHLQEAFAKFGEIASVYIQRDPVNGKSKKNGCILFKKKDDALRAKEAMNGLKIKD